MQQSLLSDSSKIKIIYCDAACVSNGEPDCITSIGIHDVETNKIYAELTKDTQIQTNNRAELIAISRSIDYALYMIKNGNAEYKDILIMSDSDVSVKCINGEWQPKKNLDLLIAVLEKIQQFLKHGGSFKLKWCRGHSDNEFNNIVDMAACKILEPYRKSK